MPVATCRDSHQLSVQGALIMRILRGKFAPVPATYSGELRGVIAKCLSLNSKARPSSAGLLALPAVQAKARELGIELPAAKVRALVHIAGSITTVDAGVCILDMHGMLCYNCM
jgi:hypothetical protein